MFRGNYSFLLWFPIPPADQNFRKLIDFDFLPFILETQLQMTLAHKNLRQHSIYHKRNDIKEGLRYLQLKLN